MSKYKNILDMSNNNSAAQILKNIKNNTDVLEFGADNGYMTEYMKTTLNCNVSIVEINDVVAQTALQFSNKSFIGEEYGDIEKYYWKTNDKYDHILFADVLEHLYNPHQVLGNCMDLLKENGTILFSIPNVSHNSIIIDLIKNNFQYRKLGLLDTTHIRFFTRKTLTNLVSNLGLKIVKEMNTYSAPEYTEFANSLQELPPEVGSFLKQRIDGEVYQFVWELAKC